MDNFLEIGAKVMLDGLSVGMDSAEGIVDRAISSMKAMFAGLGESSAAATTKIVEGSAVAGEAVQSMSERFVEAAEAAKLSAGGIGSAFGGLSVLLGGGLIAGFAANFINEAEKAVMELGHLSEKTGIAIETLSGLQVVTRELGIDFGAVETGLIRLERAQALAVSGGKSQAEALHRIGLSVAEIRDLNPEELLMKVAAAIQNTSSSADTAAAAIALFGKGGAALIPIFKEYGGTLESVMKAKAELAGMTEQAYEDAKQYTKVTADLSVELRRLALDVLPLVTQGIQWLRAGFAEGSAAVGEITIRITQAYSDMKALLDPTLSVSEAVRAFSDNSAIAAVNLKQLNKETAEAVNNALGLKAANADDPWGLNALLKAVDIRFPKPNVPTDISEPKKKKDTSTSDKVKEDQKDFDELFRAKQKFADEEDKLNLQEVEQYQKIQDIESDAFAKHEVAKLELARKTIDEELKDKKISAAEAEKLLTDLEEKEYKIRKDAIVARIKLEAETTDNPVVLAKLNAQLEALADQHQAKMTEVYIKGVEARKRASDAEEKHEQQIQDRMAKNFERLGQYELFYAKSVQDGLNHIWLAIEEAFAKSLLRMLANWASHMIMRLAMHGAEQEGEVVQQESASLQKRGLDFLDTMRTVTNAAVKAAVGAYQAVVGIPIIGPILAPIAAGVSFAAVEAFGALASAEGGWDVPRDSLALIHAQEMVLPAPLANQVRAGAAGPSNSGGTTSGATTIHVHYAPNIQAIDTSGFEQLLNKHANTVARSIGRLVKDGRLNVRMAT